jgi:predicted AAA+ superfamily ATPase
MEKGWIKSNIKLVPLNENFLYKEFVEPAIYELSFIAKGDFAGQTCLKLKASTFELPFKVFDLERKLINHIKTSYKETEGNIGLIFNGEKGTGKSVTAKILANELLKELKLPVVVINNYFEGMYDFIINNLNFECILFFDEYEKLTINENRKDLKLLSIMDGIESSCSSARKLFILTTNSLSLNPNMIERPSRIRFIKTFKGLSEENIKEYISLYLNDHSKDTFIFDFILKYLETRKDYVFVIDKLKILVEEINIHNINTEKDLNELVNILNI